MPQNVVPDNNALIQKLAAIRKSIEESYKERLALADPSERKVLKREMTLKIEQAIKADTQKMPWWQRGHISGPWIR